MLPHICYLTDKCTIIYEIAIVKFIQKKEVEALKWLSYLLAINPKHEKGIIAKGLILCNNKDFDRTIEFLLRH